MEGSSGGERGSNHRDDDHDREKGYRYVTLPDHTVPKTCMLSDGLRQGFLRGS